MGADFKDRFVVDEFLPGEVLEGFFRLYTVGSVRDALWYVFKAWVFSPAGGRSLYSDEEIALLLDQLIDLVAAASTLHEANRAGLNLREGDGHD